jgi:hypothetical protein
MHRLVIYISLRSALGNALPVSIVDKVRITRAICRASTQQKRATRYLDKARMASWHASFGRVAAGERGTTVGPW